MTCPASHGESEALRPACVFMWPVAMGCHDQGEGIAKCLSGVIEQDLSVQVAWKLWKRKG